MQTPWPGVRRWPQFRMVADLVEHFDGSDQSLTQRVDFAHQRRLIHPDDHDRVLRVASIEPFNPDRLHPGDGLPIARSREQSPHL